MTLKEINQFITEVGKVTNQSQQQIDEHIAYIKSCFEKQPELTIQLFSIKSAEWNKHLRDTRRLQ